MLASTIILVILSAVLPALMAPTRKPDVPLASDFVGELKKFQSQLRPLQDEFKKILQAVEKGTHERSEKNEEHHEDAEKHEKEEKDEEEDDFISRVAEKVAGKLSIEDPSAKIQRLVNLTSHRLVAKMNASHDNVYEFKSKLLGAVIKILNERALKYEPPVNKSLPPAPKGVDERKVVQALEELLEGPLISGFVSQEQERKMIRSAIIALSKDFGISKSTTKDIIEMMINHVEQDVKSLSESNGKNSTAQPMTDEEKILGLEKMVEDKVTENNLNLDEMKFLVKGLAAAVGARNNLSEEQTKHLEEKIRKGVYEFFAKNKIPKNEASEISQLINNKNVPEGFREAQEKKDKAKDKRSFEVEKEEKEDGNLSALLEGLEEKWNEEKKSSVEAKKQKQYLKEILSNSLALMESLETEQKQRRNESQHTSQTDEKDHRKEIQTEEKGFRKEIQTDEKEHRQEILADEKEHRKGIQTEKEHRKEIEKGEKEHRMEIQSELKDHRQEIEGEEKEYAEKKAHGESEKPTPEPTKQATNKPTNTTKENGRTTEKQNVQSHASTKPMEKNGTSQPMEKTNVTSQDQKQPIEKRDGISDDMAKEIEEAEAEIQREIEIQQRKEEKKMMALEEEKNEKEKAKEKKQIIQKPKISKDKMNEAEKELEKELKEQEKENKQKEKLKVSKEEINAAEKEIEKELEEQAKALKSKVTTAKPATTKKNNAETNNELIRQLDDLFQDS